MTHYIAWSIRQLYLLVFQPTAFRRQAEGEAADEPQLSYRQRLVFLVKLFPFVLILAAFGNFIAGHIYQSLAKPYMWMPSYLGVLLGIAAGGVFGASLRASATIAGSICGGIVLGVVGGVAVGFLSDVWIFLAIGVFAGPIVGTIIGLVFRKRRSRTQGPAPVSLLSAIGGLALGIGIFVPIANGKVPIDIYNGLGVSLGAALGGGIVSGFASAAVFGLNGGSRFGFSLGVVFGFVGGIAFGITGTAIFGFNLGVAVAIAFLIGFPLALWTSYFRLINYPLNCMVATLSYYVARQSHHAAFRMWRFCPVIWDEVIWLPLPFLGKFLLLLFKQDRDFGLKQISFITTERSLQRHAVLRSVSELVLSDLNAASLTDLAATPERLRWTTEEPVCIDTGVVPILALFDRVAQHGKQYLSVHSVYRKNIALQSALKDVQSVRKSLIYNPSAIAPRFLQIAEYWSTIIDEEQKALAARATLTRNLINPFIIGEPVREDFNHAFTGRQEIVSKIEESMLGRLHTATLLLYGPRRMGKTSILEQLPRLLGPEFAPVFIDCQNPAVSSATSDLGVFLKHLSVKITEGLRRRHVVIEALTQSELERYPFSVFDEWLNNVESKLSVDMRVLLCLDEYERLQKILQTTWGNEFLDLLRHLIQHRPSFALMFCGAHTFAESGPAWTSRFINAKLLRVSFLSYEDVFPLLTKPIPEFDLLYEPGVVEALYKLTRGQPYLTQLVASELVEYLNEQQRKQAGLADLEIATSRALDWSEYFFNIWFDAGEKGQAILCAIAMKEVPPNYIAAREWLEKHEVLNKDGTFAVPMVERWVRNRAAQVG
jgi:uncharacterized protein